MDVVLSALPVLQGGFYDGVNDGSPQALPWHRAIDQLVPAIVQSEIAPPPPVYEVIP